MLNRMIEVVQFDLYFSLVYITLSARECSTQFFFFKKKKKKNPKFFLHSAAQHLPCHFSLSRFRPATGAGIPAIFGPFVLRPEQQQWSVVDAIKAAAAWTPLPRAVTNQNSDNSHTLLILLIFLVSRVLPLNVCVSCDS
ncbi:hypothetical protein Hanom_Chr10g00925411 [Helianthus anomalus]